MSNTDILKQDALAGLDNSFIKENPVFVEGYRNIDWHDITSLNNVLKSVDDLLKTYPTPNNKIKIAVEIIFRQTLTRYPLLFGYWKKFTAIEYQFHDLATSLKTLEDATEAFPHSIDLWCDYLRVLTINFPKETELINTKITKAKLLIGWQFYSHPFWDLIIEYYGKNGIDVIPTYNEVVRIPLHQYAKYIGAFKKVLQGQKLTNEMKKIDQLGKQNQTMVGVVWPFESTIKQTYFNLTPLPEDEPRKWTKYLQYLIENHPSKRELIESVFERSLIPCCHMEEIWEMYLRWTESLKKPLDLDSVTNIIELCKRGCRVLPDSDKKFRLAYLSFLESEYMSHGKEADLLISESFEECVKMVVNIWPYRSDQTIVMQKYLRMLKRTKFSSSIDMLPKDILAQQVAYSNYLKSSIDNFTSRKLDIAVELDKIINSNNIPIVIVELIKVTWLILKNVLQTRKYFNLFSKCDFLNSSVEFWTMYYDFEKSTKNFVKLNRFIGELGTEIFLPTDTINNIVKDYREFYLLNSTVGQYRSTFSNKNDIPGKRWSSVVDPVIGTLFKVNNPRWTPDSGKQRRINKVEWQKSIQYKENGHPGISTDRPQITNTIIEQSSHSFKNLAPGLPTFRNLEKINHTGSYRDYYTESLKSDPK